jgi:5'-nucleotidase
MRALPRGRLASFIPLALAAVTACGAARHPPRAARPSTDANAASASLPAGARAPLHVRLLAFNDFHGNLEAPTGRVPGVEGEVGGVSYLAAHMKRLGAKSPNTIVVAAGDLVGASPLASALFHDEPTVEALGQLGLEVTSLGNHELDEGLGELLRLRRGGCHPKDGCVLTPSFGGSAYEILGANVADAGGGPRPLAAYAIRTFEGVPIAFVGMTLKGTPHSVTPEAVRGLAFEDEVATMRRLVPELRARGVEAIVLLIHQGGSTSRASLDGCDGFHGPIKEIVERLDPAVDTVISGHTHALYNCVVSGRPVTSALSFGRVFTAIDLTIDRATRDVVHAEAHNHAVTHDVAPDPEVEAIVERARRAARPLQSRVIGRIARALPMNVGPNGESPLGDVIADAQLEATRASGAEIALTNAHGIRSDLVFQKSGEETDDGMVTYGEAFAAQPFGNTLVTMTLTGAEVVALLERELRRRAPLQVSDGLLVRVGPAHRIVDVRLRGAPIAPAAKLRVTVNSYLAEGDATLKRGTDRVVGPNDVAALESYFRAHAVVGAAGAPRIVSVAAEHP